MVRVFYSQKTEQVFEKMQLSHWRQLLHERLSQRHQDLSDNWRMCALGERINKEGKTLEKISDLTPEARLLGYDFSVAIQKRDNDLAIEILEKIEGLPTVWRR